MKYSISSSGIIIFMAITLVIGCGNNTENSAQSENGQVSLERSGLIEKVENKLNEKREDLFAIYRDLHRHPEVSGQEVRTAGVIADRLGSLGLEVQTDLGGHGVVGILKGGKEGPVVAYRADMDAVPDQSPDPVDFKSDTPGVRHICGHDAHVTIALGIAEALASIRVDLAGTIKFIFQPAEEIATGARAMIADGVLKNPAPQAILALHCAPLETGQITASEGLMLAGFDTITITLEGEGNLKTAGQAAAKLISSVNSDNLLPPQAYLNTDPPSQDVDSGFIYAVPYGFEEKPESKQLILNGLIRASSEEYLAAAKNKIMEGLAALTTQGIAFKFDYIDRALPDVINDPDLVRGAATTIKSILGEEGLVAMNAVPPYFSEDFALYLQTIPGALYFLGVSNAEKGIVGMPHSPQFAVDLNALIVGAKTMSAVLLDYLDMIK